MDGNTIYHDILGLKTVLGITTSDRYIMVDI